MNETRRPPTWLRRTSRLWQFLGFAVAAVVVLSSNPFKAHTITPFDLLVTRQAWSWVAPPNVQARDAERSDILDGLLPLWITAKKQIRSGELPLWNPNPAGGSPELPFITAIFTPAFAIFAAVPQTALAFYLAVVFNLAIAGLGMYCFLRRRLGWLGATMGALTFEFCGFHAAWLYWPHVLTSIWFPWLLLAVDRCAEKPTWSRGVAIAAATALVILGGFPFVASLVLEAGFLYAAILAVARWRNHQPVRRHAFAYMDGTAIGFFLCAIPLYAFVHWFQRFDLDYRQGGGFPLDTAKYLFAPWSYGYQHVEFTMYVGMLALALAVIGVFSIVAPRTRRAPLWLFGILLFIAAFGLVFNLWPLWLIGWIPGMSSNPWTRSICILDGSLIILAALGLDYLASRQWAVRNPAVKLLLVVVAIIQVADMAHFFHDYNGATRSAYAYPKTPSITYMQKHVGPFDYVIADDSFLSSGTLGAYGLHEWFAHAFANRPVQHAMIRMAFQPFTSRTASILPADQIKFDSRAMSVFNVKYIATRSNFDPYAIYPPHPPTSTRTALPPLPANAWTQTIDVDEPSLQLTGVSVRLATYQKTGLSGEVTLTIRNAAGQAVASTTISAGSIQDNLMHAFWFGHPVDLPQGSYSMSVDYRPGPGSSDPLTAWAFNTSAESSLLAVNGHPQHQVLDYALHVAASRDNLFRPVFTADGTTVFENTQSPSGPYFLTSIRDQPTASSGAPVSITSYRSSAFSLRYHGSSPGVVVVPMGFTRGWRVEVNGKPVKYLLKDGVMPAVPVNAPSTISFTYEPQASKWLAVWGLLTLMAFGVMYAGDWYLGREKM